MARTSPRPGLALPQHALREPGLDGALRHLPVPRAEEHELLEAGVLPASDEVVPHLLGAPGRLRDERIPDERRADDGPPRLRAELVEPLVVAAALGEPVLGAHTEASERVPAVGVAGGKAKSGGAVPGDGQRHGAPGLQALVGERLDEPLGPVDEAGRALL